MNIELFSQIHPAYGVKPPLKNYHSCPVIRPPDRDIRGQAAAGYPKKLRGKEIHLYGRICSISDVFDALTSDRPYRKKMDSFKALKLMKEEMIEHFQKDLFEQFVMLFSRS
jgi:hypothetical protein